MSTALTVLLWAAAIAIGAPVVISLVVLIVSLIAVIAGWK